MAIVTISGEIGSGGQEIGREAARLVGADYVDRELLAEAAQRTGIELREWTAHDMRVATLSERVTHLFQSFIQRSAQTYTGDPYLSGEPILSRTYEQLAQPPSTPEQQLDDQQFLEVTTQIIRELAEMGNVVIIGRGATYLLNDHPSVLHVLTTAPLATRVRLIMNREQLSQADAEWSIDDRERHRIAFLRKFFHIDPLDPEAFDIVLRTGRLGLNQYAEIVAAGARALDARVLGGE